MTDVLVVVSAVLAVVSGALLVLSRPGPQSGLLAVGGLLFAIWVLLFVPYVGTL